MTIVTHTPLQSATGPGGNAPQRLLASHAWVEGRWQAEVLLEIAPDGTWGAVTPGVTAPPADAQRLPGPVLPGLVNAHSHAFQRAFAGLAERREGTHDDFWSWRDRMYGVALRITPDELQAVATTLYREMRAGGYTHVCEFHYLHHAPDGTPYPDRGAMARALARAAQQAGIGLTLLPVLYERASFTQPQLRADQRRFATTVDQVISMRDEIRAWRLPGVDAGVAIHSLRAARAESIAELARRCADDPGPVHVHIAEQTGEVEDCLAATGQRPIEWLCANVRLDARWHLVHATHACPAGWARACRCPSARTATSAASGRASCSCWNTASAWCIGGATSPPHPNRASLPRRSACSRPCCKVAPQPQAA
jgi:formimidoylglutamate deiminase